MNSVETGDQHHLAPQLEEHAVDPIVEKVLLATDGGPAGEGALRWVAHRSRMHRIDVDVMTVVEVGWLLASLSADPLLTLPVVDGVKQDVLEDFRRHSMGAAERARRYLGGKAPSGKIRVRVVDGEPREAFHAASASADMIVVGSNRTGVLSGLLGPSFSVKLIEGAQCPAIVVPKDWAATQGSVVLGVQGYSSDEPAVLFALHEARVMHRPLRVIHAWSLPAIVNTGIARQEVLVHQGAALKQRIAELRASNVDLDIEGVLIEGEPVDALFSQAESAELLVMGTHNKAWVDRFFVGSVTSRILSRPPCAVAVIRPHMAPTVTRRKP